MRMRIPIITPPKPFTVSQFGTLRNLPIFNFKSAASILIAKTLYRNGFDSVGELGFARLGWISGQDREFLRCLSVEGQKPHSLRTPWTSRS